MYTKRMEKLPISISILVVEFGDIKFSQDHKNGEMVIE